MTTNSRKAVAGRRASANASGSATERGRSYFDVVRRMTTDPEIRKVVDETERTERQKRRKS